MTRVAAVVCAFLCRTWIIGAWALSSAWLVGCGSRPPAAPVADPRGAAPAVASLHGTRWIWTGGTCSDGPLDLSAQGYEAALELRVREDRLMLIEDRSFLSEPCAETLVQTVRPAGTDSWHPEETVAVRHPLGHCSLPPERTESLALRVRAGALHVVRQRSAWCGGYDANLVYRAAPPTPRSAAQLARRYVAHFNRRDAGAIAALFAEQGVLVEPFSSTSTGLARRHEGQQAVHDWHHTAFGTLPWLAMRLTALEQRQRANDGEARRGHASRRGASGDGGPGAESLTVHWQYMDPWLRDPLRGVSHLVVAAGEIFEAQIALEGNPVRRPRPLTAEQARAGNGVGSGGGVGRGEPYSPARNRR